MFARPQPDRVPLVSKCALVADDDSIMREILCSLLAGAGYVVVSAANGREALAIASDHEFSVAIVDLAMPNGNGLQMCAALRKFPKWYRLPIVVLTHYSIGTALKAALRAGASGFVCKPLVPSELLWCLENQITRTRAIARSDLSLRQGFDLRSAADPVTEERPPSVGSEWILRHASASLDLQWEDLDDLPPSVSAGTSDMDQISGSLDDKPRSLVDEESPLIDPISAEALEDCSLQHLPGAIATHASNAMNMDALSSVAKFLGPSVMARFLGKLGVSIEEILSALNDSGMVRVCDERARQLHNLAGTSGTLGCGALSIAARDLEYDRSGTGQIQQKFIEIARATLRMIDAYVIMGLSDAVAAAPSTRSLHVLVVDDTEMTCEIASAFLRRAGYTVTCVHGGAEAIAAVATTDFQVVLMDVRMPGMDGLEATRRIRVLEDPRGRVPIVALTALSFADQIAECFNAGMDGHLAKPFNPDTLLAAVRAQLA
jgi:CheY-like chemotaxis protein